MGFCKRLQAAMDIVFSLSAVIWLSYCRVSIGNTTRVKLCLFLWKLELSGSLKEKSNHPECSQEPPRHSSGSLTSSTAIYTSSRHFQVTFPSTPAKGEGAHHNINEICIFHYSCHWKVPTIIEGFTEKKKGPCPEQPSVWSVCICWRLQASRGSEHGITRTGRIKEHSSLVLQSLTLLQLTVSFVSLVVNKSVPRTCRLAWEPPLLWLHFEAGWSVENYW